MYPRSVLSGVYFWGRNCSDAARRVIHAIPAPEIYTAKYIHNGESVLDGGVLLCACQVFMAASVFMIVAFTFERHFAICNPHTYRIHIRDEN